MGTSHLELFDKIEPHRHVNYTVLDKKRVVFNPLIAKTYKVILIRIYSEKDKITKLDSFDSLLEVKFSKISECEITQ